MSAARASCYQTSSDHHQSDARYQEEGPVQLVSIAAGRSSPIHVHLPGINTITATEAKIAFALLDTVNHQTSFFLQGSPFRGGGGGGASPAVP
jgi:hypothetical protein